MARSRLSQPADRTGWTAHLARAVLARPRTVLFSTLVLLVLASAGLPRLELRTDGRALVPAADPAVVHDDRVQATFGLRDPIVVVLETDRDEGIFHPEVLGRVVEISQAISALDGIEPEHVTSLATERGDRVRPGTLEFRTFLDPVPDSAEQLSITRGDLEAVDVLFGTLISHDRRSTAILVGVPGAFGPSGLRTDRVDLYRRVRAAVEPLAGEERVRVVGAPVAEALLGEHIVQDLARLLPLAILVMATVLYLGCRRFWGVVLGLSEVGAVLLFVFGVMGWLGSPVYLTTAVLPVILVTLGLADEIHVFWRHQQNLARDDLDPLAAPARTLCDMAPPVLATSITTSLGFLSFLASPLPAVREFGLYAALGIGFCLVFSLTAVPAALLLLGAERLRRPEPADRGKESPRGGGAGTTSPGSRLRRWLVPVLDRPRAVLIVVLGLSLVAVLGASRLRVQDSWIDGFAAGSPFRLATEQVNEDFFGTHLLLLDVRAMPVDGPAGRSMGMVRHGLPGPLLLPDRLWKIGQLEEFVRQRPGVGGVLGPYTHALTASFLRRGRQELYRTLPTEPAGLDQTLHWLGRARGENRLREIFHDSRRRGIVTVFLERANYRDTAELMAEIRRFEIEHLWPVGMSLAFAGDVAVSQAMIPVIVRTQVLSLALALLGAWIGISLLRRSWVEGAWIVAPSLVAVLWVSGVMGWTGMPLGVATSMFCAITLGIGVDYGIHFVHAYERHARPPTGSPSPRPVLEAVSEAGPAIVFDALAIGLGFGLLTLSQVPANARLGLLVALALSAGCVATLVGLGLVLDRRVE